MAQVLEKPATKHDAFVEGQLARAERRVRFVDLSAALLGLLAGTLAYLVCAMLLDRLFILSTATRQLGGLLYLAAVSVYSFYLILRPLRLRVNPHFAARKLESATESDRNHLVNWVDLRKQKLPGLIKTTLSERAAKDLADVEPEQVISGKRMYVTGGAVAFAAVLLVSLFFAFGLTQFRSLLGRAVLPFGAGGIPTRTQVSILRPGDATVTIGQPVTIVASVSGARVPRMRDADAPCLLYRHDESEQYRQRYLQPDEGGGEWSATVAPTDVGGGFTYKVTAGDAETPEYRIIARAAPNITEFKATYKHRPYVGKADIIETQTRKLQGLVGTTVVVDVVTNREVVAGILTYDNGQVVNASLIPEKPQSLRFMLQLTSTRKYRIAFSSSEGEKYEDVTGEDIIVLEDHLPRVQITEPGKDVTLPANGHLEIKGTAEDDIGVAKVELRLALDGKPIANRPYMADKLGKPNFGTPAFVDYLHVLELPTLVDEQGKKVELKPGMVVEYRLAAADACDVRVPPQNEVVSEPAYKITISEPKNDQKQQKARDDAQKRQKEHEKKEEERIKEEEKARAEKEQQENKQNQADQNGPPKEDMPPQGEPKKDDKGGAGAKDSKQEEKDDDTAKAAEKLKEALNGKDDKKEKNGEANPGEGKAAPKDGQGGEGKGGDPKQGEGKGDGKAGDEKQAGMGEGKQPDGEGKDGDGGKPGQKSKEDKGKPSEGRGPGGAKGSEKKDGESQEKQQRAAKEKSNEPKESPGEGKGKDGEKRLNPKDATPEDAKKALEDLKGNDIDKKCRGAKALGEMADKANNQDTKDLAQRLLNEAKEDGTLDKNGKVPGGKEGKGEMGEEAFGPGKPGEKGDPEDKQPGEGKDGDASDTQGGGGGTRAGEPVKRNDKPERARPSQMQLEEFKKKVDKDVLKKSKMSQEQFDRFLRDYADMLKRQEAGERERLPDPSRGGNLGATGRTSPGATGPARDDVRNEGRGKAPPGYRDSYTEFLRRLRESQK